MRNYPDINNTDFWKEEVAKLKAERQRAEFEQRVRRHQDQAQWIEDRNNVPLGEIWGISDPSIQKAYASYDGPTDK